MHLSCIKSSNEDFFESIQNFSFIMKSKVPQLNENIENIVQFHYCSSHFGHSVIK